MHEAVASMLQSRVAQMLLSSPDQSEPHGSFTEIGAYSPYTAEGVCKRCLPVLADAPATDLCNWLHHHDTGQYQGLSAK